MKQFLFMCLFTSGAFAQSEYTYKIPSQVTHSFVTLDSGWRFQAGDNLSWADPEFDDSHWPSIMLSDGANLEEIALVPKGFSTFWIRLQLINPIDAQMGMRVFQSGASEIYLDGKRIHNFGVVNQHADSAEFFNPMFHLHSFPLRPNTNHTLAIRFTNMPIRFPVYPQERSKSFLSISVSTLDFGSVDPEILKFESFKSNFKFPSGIFAVLFVLFLAYYIIFPSQKINLYFSLCCLFFAVAFIFEPLRWDQFGFEFAGGFFTVAGTFMLFKSILSVLNQKLRKIYKVILGIGILSIPFLFVFGSGNISLIFGILILIETVRICIKALTTTKSALIILIGSMVPLVFWIYFFVAMLMINDIPSSYIYIPFVHVILPVSLAVYIGYTFGTTSQSLQKKLKEVKVLSEENRQILAVQNETLEKQVEERTFALNQSLDNLKATQAQLIHSEKMASLGELTAGIAHEIQNPLNFVNNFSDVNSELAEELREEIEKGNIEEAKAIAKDIKDNEQKIVHHGKRAEEIVKSMLQHSRGSDGKKEPTDINMLADEYLRLAFHGMRAKDKSFNADFKLDLDESLPKINVVPQDIGRVLLNLINNAFYAVSQKSDAQSENYKPTVTVSTKSMSPSGGGKGEVEISVKDNGPGISEDIKDKIFQPFFTTKSTGQGTGLGLSLSYDIITKGHGGKIEVKSKERIGTEFLINIPLK